jgi:hypothetical protein
VERPQRSSAGGTTFGRKKNLEQELSERGGVAARAQVISAHVEWTNGARSYADSAATPGSTNSVKGGLKVEPEGESPFEATFRQTFSGQMRLGPREGSR